MANLKDLIVSGSARILGNLYATLKGNADTATKLETPRTIRTNLASTSAPDFDGTTNITPGVTGTLPVANGGTGQTSIANIQAGKDADGNVISTTYATKTELDDNLDTIDGKLSNCLLEIPQNIKVTLENNVLTLKAGSVVVKSGENYRTYTLTEDKTLNFSLSDDRYVILWYIGTQGFTIAAIKLSIITSGSSLPETGTLNDLFFNTSDKIIYIYKSTGWSTSTYNYPLCIIEVTNGVASFTKDSNGHDMIFNGAGFIGHHTFVYPNIKGLIPNGFNEDGSLKSINKTTNTLSIIELPKFNSSNREIFLKQDGFVFQQMRKPDVENYEDLVKENWYIQYVRNDNKFYQYLDNVFNQCYAVSLSSFKTSTTEITDFVIRQPVRLITKEMFDKFDSGTLLPNFDTMPVLKTIEFDTADSNWHTIFTRTNTETNPADLTDILYFRMTVTGRSINQVIDYGIIFRGQLNYPVVISKQYPGTSDGNYTGSRYYRTIFPKNLNNGYNWSFEVLQNRNNNARHYKVEIFKTTSKITWTAGTATIFNGTYHNSNQQGTETNAGYHINWLNGTINQSSWASNINGQLSKIINTSYPAGEALLANQFLFMNNNKYYPATNKALVVEPGFGIQVNITAFNINNDVGWDRIRQKCRITSLTNIPHATLARGNPCYFRCTKDSEGNIYSDNYIATSMSAGYVWYYVGTAESASVINIDTTQSFFITLDNNGETTHINGKQISDKVFSGSISNCITEIPQNIKLELDANVLTLKAGSTVVGMGSDTYSTYTFTSDLVRNNFSLNEDGKFMLVCSSTYFSWWKLSDMGSGNTLPADNSTYNKFFLTTDKRIYSWSTDHWAILYVYYPIAIVERDSNNITHFAKDSNGNDMIFNGACFVGHHAVIYPGVEWLAANNINTDGTLKSAIVKNSALQIIELKNYHNVISGYTSTVVIARTNIGEYASYNELPTSNLPVNPIAYLKDENVMCYFSNDGWTRYPGRYVKIVDFNYDGTTVIDFTIRQPIRLVTTEMLDEITNNIIPTSDKRNIGEIVQSTIPLNDAALHLLDGSLISGSGTYSAFVTYMSSLVSSHSNLFCSEVDWQATYTEYGVCGKFVYDSTNNTIRLPYITGFIEGTLAETSLGNVTEAGLPNITGILGTSGYVGEQWSNDNVITGAFYKDTSLNDKKIKDHTGTGTGNYNFGFDASRSSSIYGNSNTVQPQSIKVFYYISLANTIKTDIEVDIDNIQTELNDTVRVSDLTEVAAVVETYKNGADWYRVWSDGWIEQGGKISIVQDTQTTVNLLKTYTDINYTVLITACKTGLETSGNGNFTVEYVSTSQFKWGNGDDFSGTGNWYACGY